MNPLELFLFLTFLYYSFFYKLPLFLIYAGLLTLYIFVSEFMMKPNRQLNSWKKKQMAGYKGKRVNECRTLWRNDYGNSRNRCYKCLALCLRIEVINWLENYYNSFGDQGSWTRIGRISWSTWTYEIWKCEQAELFSSIDKNRWGYQWWHAWMEAMMLFPTHSIMHIKRVSQK